MLKGFMLALAASVAALALSAATAGAFSFSFAPSGSIRLASEGQLSFRGGTSFSVACNTSLGGRLISSAVEAAAGTTFGELTEGSAERCSGGTITLLGLRERWQLAYESSTGELPDALSEILFKIKEAAFLASVTVRETRVSCLYKGDAAATVAFPEAEEHPYVITRLTLSGNELRKISGSELCPATAALKGTLAFSATQRVAVTPAFTWTPTPFEFGEVFRTEPNKISSIRFENTTAANCDIERITLPTTKFSYDTNLLRVNEIIMVSQSREIRITYISALPLGAKAFAFTVWCRGVGGMGRTVSARAI